MCVNIWLRLPNLIHKRSLSLSLSFTRDNTSVIQVRTLTQFPNFYMESKGSLLCVWLSFVRFVLISFITHSRCCIDYAITKPTTSAIPFDFVAFQLERMPKFDFSSHCCSINTQCNAREGRKDLFVALTPFLLPHERWHYVCALPTGSYRKRRRRGKETFVLNIYSFVLLHSPIFPHYVRIAVGAIPNCAMLYVYV